MTIVGARPQLIKASVLSRVIQSNDDLEEILVHTGQHYDFKMSGAFFEELEIPEPRYALGVGSGRHGEQTGEMMKKLEPVLLSEKPEMVIVYGDTNSTLAGALVAAKLNCPVAHVEAGLRSFNRRMPEEMNRIVTDHVSTLLFCPTTTACKNLQDEGIREGVIRTGDVMYDVALQYADAASRRSRILGKLNLRNRAYLVVTIHRAENTDDRKRMESILTALNTLSREMTVVLPLHPRTSKMIAQYGFEDFLSRLRVIEPVGFLDMLMLIRNAALVCTDSGGVQKEAYFHKTGCVTLRDQTEWTETVEAGWNVLVDTESAEDIVESVHQAMAPECRRTSIEEYGDGKASFRIREVIRDYLGVTRHQ